MGFKVQRKMCSSCIYRKSSPLDVKTLEAEVRDLYMGFQGYRACHHAESNDVCCQGFWKRHKDEFQAGQIAQRLNLVDLVDVDDLVT